MSETAIASAPASGRASTAARAAANLARRKNAEWRFRAYGIVAIAIAMFALVALLASVVSESRLAFTTHRLALPVRLDAAQVDPAGARDPQQIRTRGNFSGLVQNALYAAFPNVVERVERRALSGLVTALAATDLAKRVAANPGLIGTEIPADIALSDDASLYLKGAYGADDLQRGRGEVALSGIEGEITLAFSANALSEPVGAVKRRLGARAARLQDEFDGLSRRLAALNARIAALEPGAVDLDGRARAELEREQTALSADLAQRRLIIDDLRARSSAIANNIPLDADTPAIFVEAQGGIIELTSISADQAIGRVLVTPQAASPALAGEWRLRLLSTPESARKVSNAQVAWTLALKERGHIRETFNLGFFTRADSREPELAGIAGALMGSLLTMIVTALLSIPIGVAAAIYLEEYSKKNWLTDLIEVNINNLAAVPSIVFGLLGLALFLNFMDLPRSAPLVGGLVLTLMTLPTVIIATRAALKAVPPSIRQAALGVGASKTQAIFHHVLPLAVPGIMTGAIIGLAQAMGETAPLLMIGMVAFVADVPSSFTDPATVMPVQVFIWSNNPERAWAPLTAAAILLLLAFMILMNAVAVYLRRRFERRW